MDENTIIKIGDVLVKILVVLEDTLKKIVETLEDIEVRFLQLLISVNEFLKKSSIIIEFNVLFICVCVCLQMSPQFWSHKDPGLEDT